MTYCDEIELKSEDFFQGELQEYSEFKTVVKHFSECDNCCQAGFQSQRAVFLLKETSQEKIISLPEIPENKRNLPFLKIAVLLLFLSFSGWYFNYIIQEKVQKTRINVLRMVASSLIDAELKNDIPTDFISVNQENAPVYKNLLPFKEEEIYEKHLYYYDPVFDLSNGNS